jgi:hypothetical protein
MTSWEVRLPTPFEVRFHEESKMSSSRPVARSTACTASHAMRPSGKPVGNLCPLPLLVTVTRQRRVGARTGALGTGEAQVEDIAEPVPGEPGVLDQGPRLSTPVQKAFA